MNEVERAVEEVVTGLCGRHSSVAAEAGGEGSVGWSRGLWDDLEAAELTLASVPVENGGAGAAVTVAMAALRAAGRAAATVPLAEALLAGLILSTCGETAPAGPLAAADGRRLHLRRTPEGGRLTGALTRVPWAGRASTVALLVADEGDLGVVALDAAEISVVPGRNLAGEPRDAIELDLELDPSRVHPAPRSLAAELLAFGALCRAASMVGAAEAALSLTVEYTGQRQQFGRPLARFQAVQQQLAVLIAEVSAMRSAADAAAASFDLGGDSNVPVAAAKVVTSAAAGRVARIAHQLHGAIGFTDEYELHRFTSRLWSWREEFGDETRWSRRLGRDVLGAGGLWPAIGGAAG